MERTTDGAIGVWKSLPCPEGHAASALSFISHNDPFPYVRHLYGRTRNYQRRLAYYGRLFHRPKDSFRFLIVGTSPPCALPFFIVGMILSTQSKPTLDFILSTDDTLPRGDGN